ncbi:hypothetical protein [Citricoccus sp. GCM10030269]|uniref:hypothetical protein n=1 Tax=Citricoccus sp. GCM10030269 TaxID=3273388 RepID=UPI00361EB15B
MTDDTDRTTKPARDRSAFGVLGIVFLAVGVTTGVAQEDWAVGIAFLALAAMFLVLSWRRGRQGGGQG